MLLPAEMTVALDRAHQHRVGILRSGTFAGYSRGEGSYTLAGVCIPAPRAAAHGCNRHETGPAPAAGRASPGPDATPASACGASARGARSAPDVRPRCAPHDAQLDPPHRQPRQPAHGRAGKRRTVVGASTTAVRTRGRPPRRSPAHAPCRLLHRLRAQKIAAACIADCQRIDARPIPVLNQPLKSAHHTRFDSTAC